MFIFLTAFDDKLTYDNNQYDSNTVAQGNNNEYDGPQNNNYDTTYYIYLNFTQNDLPDSREGECMMCT